MRARASLCGQKLIVTDINLEHNHETCPVSTHVILPALSYMYCIDICIHVHHLISQESFKHLPKQRKVDESELCGLQDMLKTRPNKKILQDHILKKTGKIVTLRDLTNMKAKLKPKPSTLKKFFKDYNQVKVSI